MLTSHLFRKVDDFLIPSELLRHDDDGSGVAGSAASLLVPGLRRPPSLLRQRRPPEAFSLVGCYLQSSQAVQTPGM